VADVSVEYDGSSQWMTVFVELAFAAIFLIPAVSRATGISPATGIGLVVLHVVCFKANGLFLYRASARGNRTAKRWMVGSAIFYNYAIAIAFVLATADPKSMFWMGVLIVVCVNGASQEIEPSVVFLVASILSPVLTIPVFLARGSDPTWSVAGPLICAGLCAAAYTALASTAVRWREVRAEQEQEISRLRALASELERRQMAQDLHDVVGSTLAMVALHADLVERHLDEPKVLLRIASAVREAAREGIGDLRGVMDALSPTTTEIESVAANLRRSGERAAEASEAEIVVTCTAGPMTLDGPVRVALVRTFQEAIHNAVRHGKARRIAAHMAGDAGEVSLEVTDNGTGFTDDGMTAHGRGLSGMRSRAQDLGGRFELTTAPGQGVRLRLALPRR
jgi:signal transduction histidine kinase